jgi:hypothetical protein
MLDRAAAGTQTLTERARKMLTLKNLHIAGVAVLAAVCLYLMGQMLYAWQSARSQDSSALARQRATMQAAEVAARPLAGLDDKLKQATVDSDKFYAQRLPYSYSEFVGELGVLKNKAGVKLTRGQNAEAPVMEGGIAPLTEIQMDVSLSGDYRPLVLFINGLERDKIFFLIRGVALVGQQSGTVGVRLGLTTYLRTPVGSEVSDKAVPATASEAAPQRGGAPR